MATPSTTTWRAVISSAIPTANVCAANSAVREAPSTGRRSALARYRAPSAAQATRVLRTWMTTPTCTTANTSVIRTTHTSVNSTTAAPRSFTGVLPITASGGSWSDGVERRFQHVHEEALNEGPEHGHDSGTHDRYQHPSRNIAALVT